VTLERALERLLGAAEAVLADHDAIVEDANLEPSLGALEAKAGAYMYPSARGEAYVFGGGLDQRRWAQGAHGDREDHTTAASRTSTMSPISVGKVTAADFGSKPVQTTTSLSLAAPRRLTSGHSGSGAATRTSPHTAPATSETSASGRQATTPTTQSARTCRRAKATSCTPMATDSPIENGPSPLYGEGPDLPMGRNVGVLLHRHELRLVVRVREANARRRSEARAALDSGAEAGVVVGGLDAGEVVVARGVHSAGREVRRRI
jgi:hypothetical protein